MNSLYDIYLGPPQSLQGYRLGAVPVRDTAPLIASRFSTGAASQTDLDLLKVDGYSALAGGMFQRTHEDSQKVARLLGVYNPFDQHTYPAPIRQTSAVTPFGQTLGKAESPSVSFAGYSYFSTGIYTHYLYKYLPGSIDPTSIALPAAFNAGIGDLMSGMCFHGNGYLFVASDYTPGIAGIGLHRYDINANTWQDTVGVVSKVADLNGVLYAINKSSIIYTVTNEFAAGAATFTQIATAGLQAYPYDFVPFNGAIYIAKDEGIYRFNGSIAVLVLALRTEQLCVFNGAIYFMSGKWLYRFDGITLTRLQYFDETMIDLSATSDYLYFSMQQTLGIYQTSDKFGVAYTTSDVVRHVYMYDGVGFNLLDERIYLSAGTVNNAYSGLVSTGSKVWALQTLGTQSLNCYEMSDVSRPSAVTTASQLEITSSEFDAGFPSVFKAFESFSAEFTGIQSGDSIAVTYQTYDGKTWSSAYTLGTITSTSSTSLDVTDDTKKLFKRIKIMLVVTYSAGSALSVKGGRWQYTLQPRTRWRWQMQIMAEGNGTSKKRDDSSIDNDANELNNLITQSIKSKTPVYLLSHDYGIVKAQINSSALSFVIKGRPPIYTDPYNEYPLVAVKNNSGNWEILRVSTVSYNAGADETTITVLERGYLGITAVQINADAEFHLCYKVYVTRLLRDAPVLSESIYNEQSTGESQLQREFMIEATEV